MEDAEYTSTDPEMLERVVELLAQTELGREYRDWGSQSLVYSLRAYTSGLTMDGQFIDRERGYLVRVDLPGIQHPVSDDPSPGSETGKQDRFSD